MGGGGTIKQFRLILAFCFVFIAHKRCYCSVSLLLYPLSNNMKSNEITKLNLFPSIYQLVLHIYFNR